MKIDYPDFICDHCGQMYGNWYQFGVYSGPEHHCATYHYADCDLCKRKNVPVTEPRDFGYLVDWDASQENKGEYSNHFKKHRKTG